MHYNHAFLSDAAELAELNFQLIQDEGAQNPMTVPELTVRMRRWLQTEYRAYIFEIDHATTAYVLYRENADYIYLRQFFVQRNQRRTGVGRQCVDLLFSRLWPKDKRVIVDVLCRNEAGIKFWRSMGLLTSVLPWKGGAVINSR